MKDFSVHLLRCDRSFLAADVADAAAAANTATMFQTTDVDAQSTHAMAARFTAFENLTKLYEILMYIFLILYRLYVAIYLFIVFFQFKHRKFTY